MILIFIVHCSISAVERLNTSDSILETSVQPSEQNEHLNISDSILDLESSHECYKPNGTTKEDVVPQTKRRRDRKGNVYFD